MTVEGNELGRHTAIRREPHIPSLWLYSDKDAQTDVQQSPPAPSNAPAAACSLVTR
jgi:hypothetical protein